MLDTFIILSIIDPPLIMLNISMVYFLYKQRPRDAKLRNGFFALFLVISVADCVGLICMIIFNQLINMGIMVDWFLSCSFCAKIHQEIDDYCRYLQLVGHAMIAFNRFSCFYTEPLHKRIWKGTPLKIWVTFLLGFPFVIIMFKMPWKVDYAILGTMYAFRYRDMNSRKISSLMNFVTDSTCTALGFIFSISTVVHLFVLRHSGKLDQFTRNSDIRLLGHSLAIFAIQVLYTMMAFHFFSLASGYKSPFPFISDTHRYFEDGYCLVGSPFLLILSSHVREEYLKFYGLDWLQRKNHRTNPLTTIFNTASGK